MMSGVLPAGVAGTFYPKEPEQLRDLISAYLSGGIAVDEPWILRAVIAPHAGFVYSGKTAGAVYSLVREASHPIRRVILLGPAHRYPLAQAAVPAADAFETPLGIVAVGAIRERVAADFPDVEISDAPFHGEHSLEVQLPFLQMTLGDFELLPLLVGRDGAALAAEILMRLAPEEGTLVVVSSDLSHYRSDAEARAIDARTSELICSLAYDELREGSCCGIDAIRGLLRFAAQRGLRPVAVRLSNSGEAFGDLTRVVGYGGYAFLETKVN